MSTQAYYKERLGFDPADTVAEHRRELNSPQQQKQQGYEESLSKFKDERDAIQKKTFTKWVNKHLKKASRYVGDLFHDLRDGHNLISLLEVLSGEHLDWWYDEQKNNEIEKAWIKKALDKYPLLTREEIVRMAYEGPTRARNILERVFQRGKVHMRAAFGCFANPYSGTQYGDDFVLDWARENRFRFPLLTEEEVYRVAQEDHTYARTVLQRIMVPFIELLETMDEPLEVFESLAAARAMLAASRRRCHRYCPHRYAPRETSGSMRFHMLDNVRIALRFLQCKNIKLVNIQAEDIVDGNPKLTLGLIWTIILHFQISDIVVGQGSHVTAKEALLRWARRSTARYPGVRVSDFTSSWRDGMAFSALVHRNRPDLLDWRCARTWQARERLERVFYIAEREYGVTRLLDPEDVDTPEPDEKSLITYISSLHEVFPEPPAIHPLYDAEAQRRLGEYRELASGLHLWLREKTALLSERLPPASLIEARKLASEEARFRSEEMPTRARDKQRLTHTFCELHKYFESVGEIDLEPELHADALERFWARLTVLQSEREQMLADEVVRLERLQRLAEKVHREMKASEVRLDEFERRIDEEARRFERVHPLEAKRAVDLLEQDSHAAEQQIQGIFADVHGLTEARYAQAPELHKRVQKLHQRWVTLRSQLHKRLVQPLSAVSFPVEERVVTKHRTTVHETRLVDTNPFFRTLHDCIGWCKSKLKQASEADYGSDLPSVQTELDIHQREHKSIEQFHTKIENCVQVKNKFHGDELALYMQHLSQLQKIYTELITVSNRRMSDLETLLDFIQSATNELVWLNSKEETELSRDWSDKNLNIQSVEQYYEALMSDLEAREIQFSSVQDRGEGLVLQHHPASKTIEAYMSAMQSQWAWLLQLTVCLEVHLKNITQSQEFFREVRQADQWILKKDELLNTIYSQSDFSLDEGERLLKGMQELREGLNNYGDQVHKLVEHAKEITPMKQRGQPITRPINVTCICSYKQVNISIKKDEQCTLYDNSGRVKWRIKNSEGVESPVSGVCFSLQPPDKEAVDAAEKLRRQYERNVALWQRKQLRLRQNMIFATIKVVKDWSLQQFLDMGQEQRSAIRKALNEDADKLLAEGDPTDPQLRRLRREMAEVNRLLDEFERRARAEEESRSAGRALTEQCGSLRRALDEIERELMLRIAAPTPRDPEALQGLACEHADWESRARCLGPDLERAQLTFRGISLKTPQMRTILEELIQHWSRLWDISAAYVERLRSLELALRSLDACTSTIGELELKLSSFEEQLPTEPASLHIVLEQLVMLQAAVAQHQPAMDQLNDSALNARRAVEASRPTLRGPHPDMDRIDLEVNRLNARWTNVCGQLVDKLRAAEVAYELAQQYRVAHHSELDNVDDGLARLESAIPLRMDAAKCLLSAVRERSPALKAVDITGSSLIREGKQAVEEKFRSWDDTVNKLLQWIAEAEDRLAHQDVVNEDIDELGNQVNSLQRVRGDIEAHARPISSCLDQVRQVTLTGKDIFSSDEIVNLEKNARSLKSRFEKVNDCSEKLLRRLLAARDELTKFTNELSAFSEWLDGSWRSLETKERVPNDASGGEADSEGTRDFVSDVIAHQADLRFITMAAQKFVDESKQYLAVLNDYRTSLPQRLAFVEPISGQDSALRADVSAASARYRELLTRTNALSDRLTSLEARRREYRDALSKAELWLDELEPRAHALLSEPLAPEAQQVEEQLTRAKALYAELLSEERLVRTAATALEALLLLVKDGATRQLREPIEVLRNKHAHLAAALAERCQQLDTALLQRQGVQDALDKLLAWLNAAEFQFKNLQRPASLVEELLEEQQRELRLLQADLDSHRSSVDAVGSIVQELLTSNSVISAVSDAAKTAKRTESKLKDIQSRFERLADRMARRSEFLYEVAQSLRSFGAESALFDVWYARMLEQLESKELVRPDAPEVESKLVQLYDRREEQRSAYEVLIRNGKAITANKDVTDIAQVRDKVKAIEAQWKELNCLLDEKLRLGKTLSDRLSVYEKLRDQLIEWLGQTESRVQRLQPVSVDLDLIKCQIEDLRPIQKEYREHGITVDKVNELGTTYDNLIRERSESPTRRRGFTSPSKRHNVSSPLRRMSQDARSPSPTKFFVVQSPVSPGGSSGFSSRRSSQDGFQLEELSVVQQQLSEINNRYGLLGVRLSDRQNELENVRDELKKCLDNLRNLTQFLDKIQRNLTTDLTVLGKDQAGKTANQIKGIIEEMYEKQFLLDSTKTQVRELVRRKTGVKGVDKLNDALEDVANRWKLTSDTCKDRIRLFELMKEFFDTYETLHSWLGAKEKMLGALGPISSDPRIVASQVQQVQVLREEFRTQQPQLDHLVQVSESIIKRIPSDSSERQKVKQKLDSILQRWSDLVSRLEGRAQSLGDAADTSREFDSSLNRLRDALQAISDNLDELPLDKDPEEQLRKIENLERQLEGQRPLLADAEAVGAQLCSVLSDPASKSDIQGKLASVGKLYNNLQRKLDHRKAEIEGNLRDGQQFVASCGKTLGWLGDELGNMSEKLLISANREILQQQIDYHEPIYRSVMSREHEVIMLLNKGRDLLLKSQNTDNRSMQRDLDKMQSQWDRLKKDTLDRYTRLQTCVEHCQKFYKTQNIFVPWLRSAEDKLEGLKPASFKHKDIEKQLKELSSFRNEVWKKSGEFENNNTLGETFLSSCDIDKDLVKNELGVMKSRWDRLNNDLLERTQALEDTMRHLTDFNENLRSLEHGLQRCEDKLASHDAIGGAAKDPKLLDRIKLLREETVALKKPLAAVRQQATDLIHKAREQGVDASHLLDEIDGISDRIEDLQEKLNDRCNELQSAATAVAQFTDILRNLSQELSSLEREFEMMKSPGRDVKTVREQAEKIRALQSKMSKLSNEVTKLVISGDNLVDSGFATDAVVTRQQVDSLRRQLGKLEERVHTYEEELNDVLDRLQKFSRIHACVMDDIVDISERITKLKPVGSEVLSIRAQQEDFQALKRNNIDPISRAVEECNTLGQALIQTAARDANTSGIEKDLDKMIEKWNDLKSKLNERERRLDVGLLQSGKFQEALDGLDKWLSDTEEMVANQKPASSDYKVVKAQLQEQKFLTKMLLDRQNSMSSLYAMGQEVAANAEAKERQTIERQLNNLMGRFDNLSEGAAERMRCLERAMVAARQFQDKLGPLCAWLECGEAAIRDMELVPTDEEKIQKRISEHTTLHADILARKPNFSELTDCASALMVLVGEDEANALADKLQEVTDRYGVLVERSEAVGSLLQRSRQALRHLVLTYQQLQAWMESIESRLSRYRVLAAHLERLHQQLRELTELGDELASRQRELDSTNEAGLELMSHIAADEALQLKDKLDSLQRRHGELISRAGELLRRAEEAMPLVQQFHERHARLTSWMQTAEALLDSTTSTSPSLRAAATVTSSNTVHHQQTRITSMPSDSVACSEDDVTRLELELTEQRSQVDRINALGPQLCALSPGEGAVSIEAIVTRDNRRFDAIAEQIQRRAERIRLGKQRELEVLGDLDELLEWFREADGQLRDAEPPSSEPEVIRVQLREQRALGDDVAGQRARARDVLSAAKRLLRESSALLLLLHQRPAPPAHSTLADGTSGIISGNTSEEGVVAVRERCDELREIVDTVSALSIERLAALEQALPLAEHLRDSHVELAAWLDEAEQQVAQLPLPALRADFIAVQQDRNELLLQNITEHKPLVDKLNKTGEALQRLVNGEDAARLQELLDNDNARYLALRSELRSRQQTLEQALQESALFSDKLEGMLRALGGTAEQLRAQEPVSAHPPRLREQMDENSALTDELAQRSEAFAAVKRAADDVIGKASNRPGDPAVSDIKRKLERLNKLWTELQQGTAKREHSLEETLAVAERFWRELAGVMNTLAELQDALAAQAPPATQPTAIERQQVALNEIRQEIDQTKPEVEQVRQSGHELMGLCGEPDKPEVRKHIEDLDLAWDSITALYARREENLIDAMEKAMEFHGTLADLLNFLGLAEREFATMGPLGSDIAEVKRQISELAKFKSGVDPHMVKIESLNRQAAELTEKTSSEQSQSIKEPLGAVNSRWDALLNGMVDRQRLLDNALLRLGQFQHALDELLVWIERSGRNLNELRPIAGEAQLIEVELAKLKVLVNDVHAHQTSVDTLNDAGRQLIEDGAGSVEASSTSEKLSTLNSCWRELLERSVERQRELEDALRDARAFGAEIQDLIAWLGDVDGMIVASKPVGGLPETASEQLERFMELYNELEHNRPKVEATLQRGKEYQRRTAEAGLAGTSGPGSLGSALRTLKQRWDSVTSRANDRKIKLEIALKEASEFHDALATFVDWLSGAERLLAGLRPVSRIMNTILAQIDDHKAFQKDVSAHRENMLNLDKKGTHLKYFSQKQDVILIKNLLVSVQHRWERVVSKSAERTRALDHGYKEAREFHEAWSSLMGWLSQTERAIEQLVSADGGSSKPESIKARLQRQRDIQKEIAGKQPIYDATMRCGKQLKDKAPKNDESTLRELLAQLKTKWTSVGAASLDQQRRLEEALLFSGQFKDALQALLEWLRRAEQQLIDCGPLHGDLDTVTSLLEQHRGFEADLESRALQMGSVNRSGHELEAKAQLDDSANIKQQLIDLGILWATVSKLAEAKTARLADALQQAERLHKAVHALLEWLSDAEMKLRFAGHLPEDEMESKQQLHEHEAFIRELKTREIEKNDTLELAHAVLAKAHPDGAAVIKHWISIIQSRWDEVAAWAQQRNHKLQDHVQALQDLDDLLEDLLVWLEGLESTLVTLEAEPLPGDHLALETLISEHREFMGSTAKRQNEVDRICKARQIKPLKDTRKSVKSKAPILTRASPGRDKTPDPSLPHIGPRFPPKGSKGAEPEFRNPRVKLLWDKWRNVWMLAWERQRHLQDKLNYIDELERVANFSWEDWRKRFLKFMNHKKSRLTDLFRKMDKNNDGLIPRDDFILGIINTKFDTSRLEMGAVADLFDRHGEGLIDWKEFIAALRPDWEERRTYNDDDKIHDEVKRLVMLCTCRQKFRVFQVGEGKYRFGDSQKLRLVRILRSTVMVRVGGGWVALDEFLVKNDPCRAKGRTNIELREQFILADGVSQSMTAFRSKLSPMPSFQRNQLSSAGPITKVRERSVRSVPMGQSRASRASLSAGTPDSLSDNENSVRTPKKKASTPYRSTSTPGGSHPASRSASRPASRPSSRPASRQGSKPSSHFGSTQSLDSNDELLPSTRIPRRIGLDECTPPSSRHNSMSGRKSSNPLSNGSSSRPRTPTEGATPPGATRYQAMSRASSIPTLAGTGITARASLSSRTSNISSSTRPSRRSSEDFDSSVTTPIRRTKQPTSSDQRAPFRL